jgi:methylglyoxal/glyoxal reductase
MSLSFHLNDGHSIPRLGCLSFYFNSPRETTKTVQLLLNAGIRHFEVTELYENAHVIIDTIKKSKIPRSEIYLTFKLWAKDAASIDLVENFKSFLKICGIDYVDLLILNDPTHKDIYMDLYRSLEQLQEEGFTKSIGVAKISVNLFLDVIRKSTIPPAVFEAELSPFNMNKELIGYCEDNSIILMSCELFSKGLRSKNKILNELAHQYELSNEELIFRWARSKNIVTLLPYDSRFLHQSYSSKEVELSPDSIEILDSLNENLNSAWIPSTALEQQDE